MNNPCISEIQKAAGRQLTDDELIDLMEELQKRVKQRRTANAGESADVAVQAAANDYAREMAAAAVIEKRNAAINLKRRLEAIDKVTSAFGSNPALGVESLLVGVNNAAKGSRISAASEQAQLLAYYMAGFGTEVEKAGHWKLFVSGKLDREIAQALWAINREQPKPAAVPREAHEIATVVAKWQEVARRDANAAGAWIKRIEGYITRQSHDTFRIRAAGYKAWRDEIYPKLDLVRTMEGVDGDVESFLKGVYQGLASGIHLKAPTDEPSPSGAAFKRPRNIAKKASAERVLHFKGADEWFDYNQKFGTGTLREALIRNLESSAQNTGLMRVLGTNPEGNLKRITDDIMKGIADPGDRAKFDKKMKTTIANQMKAVDGTSRVPVHDVLARGSATVRFVENMTRLGLSIASQFSDLPNYASEMRYQGSGGYLANIGDGIAGMARGRRSSERKEVLGMLGVFSDSMKNSITTRFSPGDDGAPGVMTRLQQQFFKWNLMQWWSDNLRRAAHESMAHRLALNAGKAWNALDGDLRRVLGMFAIDEGSWNVIRQAEAFDAEGRAYMTPEAVSDLPDEPFAALLTSQGVKPTPKRVADLKRELADKLRSYYVDRTEYAAVQPDARTTALLFFGTQPGTVDGEFWRFAVQFKSFTYAYIQKPIGREIYGRGAKPNAGLVEALRNGNGELAGIAQLILWTTAFGYISRTAKDLVKGREPMDPRKPDTWAAAMVQGGGMGILGDVLFGETRKRYGGDILTSALGPAFGSVSDIFDIWGRLKEGDDTMAAAFKTLISHIPFQNLFYLRVVLDYLVLHSITEALNPGALKRNERRVEKETGQGYLIRPSETHLQPFGR